MFSFLKRKRPAEATPEAAPPVEPAAPEVAVGEAPEPEPEPEIPAGPTFDELKRKMNDEPQNAMLALETAQAAWREGRLVDALPIMHRAARMLMDSDPEQAIEAFNTLKKMSDVGAEVHFNLAALYREQGRLQEAEMEVRAVLRRDMNDLDALALLCDLTTARGQFRDAELSCNKMLAVNPRDPIAREKLGDTFAAQQRNDEAVKAYLMAAHNFAGLQEKEEALRLYQRVLELDPSNPTASRESLNLRP